MYSKDIHGDCLMDEWPYAGWKDDLNGLSEDEELIASIINSDLRYMQANKNNILMAFAKEVLDQFDVEVK